MALGRQLCPRSHIRLLITFVGKRKRKMYGLANRGTASITIEVDANEISFKGSAIASDKRTTKKIVSKIILKSLKEQIL